MGEDFAQRRRFAAALAITLVAVPVALMFDRGDDTPTVVPLDTASVQDAGDPAQANATDPMGTTMSEFLEGTVPPSADDPATIAIPRPIDSVRGPASFSRAITDPKLCQVRNLTKIPYGSKVTVTNLDNSQSVQCLAELIGDDPEDEVVLAPEAFLQIGDLTDAPLPVEITW